jgi:large subunit ribosomal protein L22
MVKKGYQAKVRDEKKAAKAIAKNQPVSLKYATEMCREIKGKKLNNVQKRVKRILEKEEFLPLRKYNKKVAHRKGNAVSGVKSGRFPEKVCNVFLSLLDSVKANADFKGLDSENLLISHCFASRGFARRSVQSKGHISGKRRRRKSAHIEVIVMEAK